MSHSRILKEILLTAFYTVFFFALTGVGWLIFVHNIFVQIGVSILYVLTVTVWTVEELHKESEKQFNDDLKAINAQLSDVEREKYVAEQEKTQAQKDENLWKNTMLEKSSGFPSLINLIDEYEALRDNEVSNFLLTKSHPSPKGAEVVKIEAARRRKAEQENRKTQAVIEYYENIAPFLVDLKDDIAPEDSTFEEYTDEERQDPAINFLTKEEYRKLSPGIRNQMALDRFWQRPKSKWLIGRLYERYVGYLFEEQGYEVDYVGIFKGYEDLGRDLICTKGSDLVIIQCKNWSQFRTIYEKHIFQFFGTVFQYKDENPKKKVRAIFYTSTKLSDLARRFAKELGIELKEELKFDKTYPVIKCNISKVDGSKIYHLPFDQQYDNTKIEKRHGELYCATVEEAEKLGFRRAFRWSGTANK